MNETRITLQFRIPGHGAYTVYPADLDKIMDKYVISGYPALPDVEHLKRIISERSDEQGGGIDYSDLSTVTECLMVLAEYEGYGL